MDEIFVWMVNPEKSIYWDTNEAQLCLSKNKMVKSTLSEDQIGFDYEKAQKKIESWALDNGFTNPDANRIGDYGRRAAWGLKD